MPKLLSPKAPVEKIGEPVQTPIGLFRRRGDHSRDEEIVKVLISQAANARERQRLSRLQCEHAGAWISAVPSTHDGTDTVMRPRNFQVAVALRLGLPVWMKRNDVHFARKSLMFWGPCLLLLSVV